MSSRERREMREHVAKVAAMEEQVAALERKNAKLREEVDTAKHNSVRNAREYARLCHENDTLQKLVRDMWLQLLNAYDYKEVGEFADRMRELGIEV